MAEDRTMNLLKFREWPILVKIVAISVISVTFITVIILLYFMPLIEQKILEGKKEGLKNVVDVAYGFFQEYDKQVASGLMSLDEAKAQFAKRLKSMRYSDNEYFWINDLQHIMIMHPIKPDLDGQDVKDQKDPNGIFIFREFVAICKIHGAGFVGYMWPKVGENKPVPKISYVRLYEPWGWIIGSGIYIDNVKADVSRLRFYMLAGTFVFTILTISFAVTIGTGITRPLRKVILGLKDIANGKGQAALNKRIAITSIDEIGILSKEFNSLMESISSLSVFKKVIEEDDTLEEVYQRIGEVFTLQLGIQCCFIYQVISDKNTMRLTYPSVFDQEEMLCSSSILDDCSLCKAKRTGHLITSSTFPAICRQFTAQNGRHHYCLPIVVGGATVAVVQFVFDAPDETSGITVMEEKVFKAEQYINESLSVIETKRLMGSLREAALVDTLTGLYNRRYLNEYAEKMVAGVLRRGKSIGLMMCDLDYFKQVNDTYGHNVGDIVLKETSAVIRRSVRESDIVIRFGGEEFLVVLLDISEGESFAIAEKIRINIEQYKIQIPEGVIQKTISLGISEFPSDTNKLWGCIKYADVALYRAKDEGRNRCVRFTKDMWKEEQV
jgi:diguanylate cyclase (GGDEF)-like protein